MEITVNGIKIFYERYSGEGVPTLILHGWGANSQVMKVLFDGQKNKNKSVIALDFPLFGQSGDPPEDFTVYDFEKTISAFLEKLEIEKVNIIGHSFGGRVGIIAAAKPKSFVNKLVLIDSAGCRPHRGFKYRYKVFSYKIKKFFHIKDENGGSKDYQSMPKNLRGIFVRVVNEHLETQMKKIKVPTLIIWGKDDGETPMYMAKRLNKLIKDSGLVSLENAGHFSFLDRPEEINLIINAFI